jgi:predicted KAP-like P-loop ATPase
MKNKKLIEALENLLVMANQKLQYAIDKNKEWDIENYKENVAFIKSELEIVNKE